MRKYILPTLLVISIVLNLSFFLVQPSEIASKAGQPAELVLPQYSYAEKALAKMTLGQKIGQTLFISLPDADYNTATATLLNQIQPGGILLFSKNIISSGQTTQLNQSLQSWASKKQLPPLFISVDEEGGLVERIDFDPVGYSAPEVAKLGKAKAITTAQSTCTTLKDLGFNTNFAPVADVAFASNSIMSLRAYGNKPTTVSQFITAIVKEFENCGISATAKHFPGHGRTSTDSHELMPTINISKSTWLKTDALPFKAAIEANVTFIMVGHLSYPQVDKKIASMSKIWIQQILRKELAYKGIIITDDIKMGGAGTNAVSATTNALAAGDDMVIAALEPGQLQQVEAALKKYYATPDRQKQLDEKVVRILSQKWKLED